MIYVVNGVTICTLQPIRLVVHKARYIISQLCIGNTNKRNKYSLNNLIINDCILYMIYVVNGVTICTLQPIRLVVHKVRYIISQLCIGNTYRRNKYSINNLIINDCILYMIYVVNGVTICTLEPIRLVVHKVRYIISQLCIGNTYRNNKYRVNKLMINDCIWSMLLMGYYMDPPIYQACFSQG